ncbi:MAG: hypothetical protein M3431_07575, partial [Actinomycetota bacterium]|nr:hypothetical protein [Actinomycetota bacterium]
MATAIITGTVGHRRDFARRWPIVAVAALVLVAIGVRNQVDGFPHNWNINLADPIDSLHDWVQD